jgi:AraC-like DNA-binding protein
VTDAENRSRALLRAVRDRTPDAEAADLLESTDDGIARIASRVGHETSAAFPKLFHRHHGLSPGRYRTAQRLDEGKGQAVVSGTGSRRESAKKRKSGKR